ncbi:hypothetical protein KXJ78_06170 [Klebsiella grimontii]|nr:hypothetical protein KXJ78_06170 [Klebsiella grimontii]
MKQRYKKILMSDNERFFINGFKNSWFYYNKDTISNEKYDDEFLITKMNSLRKEKNAKFIYYEILNDKLIYENAITKEDVKYPNISLGGFAEKFVDRFLQRVSNGECYRESVGNYFKYLQNNDIMDSLYILQYTLVKAQKQNILFDKILYEYLDWLMIAKDFHILNNIKYVECCILCYCDLSRMQIYY